jgi:hypothetical protein
MSLIGLSRVSSERFSELTVMASNACGSAAAD